jgi:hypothetical protein
MEWLFALFALIMVGAFAEDVHTKWHKREMIKAQHWKDTVYA